MWNIMRLACGLACAATLAIAGGANADEYPSKPVRLIVGFAAGGGTDVLARALSRKLAERWPHPLVVENKPGADGAIATELVAKSAPDGYTLVMISNAHTITPFQRRLAYDPVKDFAPVTIVASTPNLLLVHPSLPVKNVAELVAYAKAHPGELTYGSSGSGTSPALSMELLKSMTGTSIVEVPYKGTAQAVLDLLGGHVQLLFGAVPTVRTYAQSGKLRAIAISSAKRWDAFPELPTVAETLPGFEAASWYGVLAPAGTPPEIVAKLHEAIVAALQSPEVKNFIVGDGFEVIGDTPEDFAHVIDRDMQKWGNLIRSMQSTTSSPAGPAGR